MVCESGVTGAVSVLKDFGSRQDLVSIPDDDSVGDVWQIVISIQMIFVPVSKERIDRQPLHHREFRADPQALNNPIALAWPGCFANEVARRHVLTERS